MEQSDAFKDLRGPAIIVVMSLHGAWRFIGPFETVEAAAARAAEMTGGGWLGPLHSVVLLEEPKKGG